MRPNIEVMCIVKFQYATSALYDHSLVLLLFQDVPISTFNFISECFYTYGWTKYSLFQ